MEAASIVWISAFLRSASNAFSGENETTCLGLAVGLTFFLPTHVGTRWQPRLPLPKFCNLRDSRSAQPISNRPILHGPELVRHRQVRRVGQGRDQQLHIRTRLEENAADPHDHIALRLRDTPLHALLDESENFSRLPHLEARPLC